jgi:hypothetical protein
VEQAFRPAVKLQGEPALAAEARAGSCQETFKENDIRVSIRRRCAGFVAQLKKYLSG